MVGIDVREATATAALAGRQIPRLPKHPGAHTQVAELGALDVVENGFD